MEFRKQDLLHEIDVVWLSSLESSKLYASCMQCNAIFKSVIVLYFFQKIVLCCDNFVSLPVYLIISFWEESEW